MCVLKMAEQQPQISVLCMQVCFVEYDSPGAAELAEESMQGANLGMKAILRMSSV